MNWNQGWVKGVYVHGVVPDGVVYLCVYSVVFLLM